ncbi:MAG: rhodanese-like domain-containing protein [Thermoflexibacter sp.]|jgi:rhodanese-related sulfurtransferase|nr:rhodanese-like domain-containing protein [Thermoflexibacter sp.]
MRKFYFFFIILFTFVACNSEEHTEEQSNLNPQKFQKFLMENPDVQLLDVRTPEEFAEGKLDGAVNIDISSNEFESQVESLDKSKPVAVYCYKGKRSEKAAKILKEKGFKLVYNLEGGLSSWQSEGLAVK